MQLRRLRLTSALALVAATLTTVPVLGSTVDAGGVAPRPELVAPTLTVAGTVRSPGGGGVNGIYVSPDGTGIFGQTFLDFVDIDLPTMSATAQITPTGGPQTSTQTKDGNTVWSVGDNGSEYYLQSLSLNTGALGTAITLGRTTYGLKNPASVAVGSVGGVNMAYVYFGGSNYYSANPEILAINLDTSTVVGNVELGTYGFAREDAYFDLALAADNSKLYLSHSTEVLAFNPADITIAPTTFALAKAREIRVWDDEPLNASNKGHLYALDDGTLTVYDLDASTTLRTVSVHNGFVYAQYSFDILDNGDIVLGREDAEIDYVQTDGTVTTINYLDSTIRKGDPYLIGLAVDENATYGTCIFAANNTDGSYTAIAVNGADCGPFKDRLGDLADIDVDGSSTMTLDPPSLTGRAAPWVAIAVYAGCELVEVLQPTFPASLTLDWADVSSGTEVTVRAYTQADLDNGSITDVYDLTCDTPYSQEATAKVAYNPFEGTQVGAGDDNSCAAVTLDSYCWGANGNGQLGNTTTDDAMVPALTANPTATPTDPYSETFTGTVITDIDSGEGYTCALASGVLYCWGANDYGQLGNNTTTYSSTPVAVSANAGFTNTNVTAFSTGEYHTCAVEGGAVYCWGYNYDGELGDGSTTDSALPLKAASSGGFTNTGVTSVGAGWDHTCAVQSGVLYCWGAGSSGQLGDDNSTDSATAVLVADNGGEGFTNSSVTQVVSGYEASCAIRSGVIFCWGYDDSGKLGYGYAGNSPKPIKVLDNSDVAVNFVNENITFLTAGYSHFCALQAGVAFCWGYGSDGQLGAGEWSDSDKPTKVASVVDGFTNASVTDIDAGYYHTCAIASGKVYCWGDGSDGKLGNGDDNGRNEPTPVCCQGGGASTDKDVNITFGGGGGSIVIDGGPDSCTATCTRSFPKGSTVTLTAVPARGYHFVGWSGACTGTGPCVIDVNLTMNVTALFEPDALPPTGSDPRLSLWAFALIGAGAALQHLARRRRQTA